jgi:HlyD family secretion protein
MACADVGGALGLWVLIYPESAGLLDARAGGQLRRLRAAVGEEVRKRQVLMELYLPVRYHQLQQQRDNRELDRRESLRLASENLSVDTSLAKLSQDRGRYQELAASYAEKVCNLRWLSQREVVAPPDLRGGGGRAGPDQHQRQPRCGADPGEGSFSRYEQVKLDIQTQALKRRNQSANPPKLWLWLVVLVVILV